MSSEIPTYSLQHVAVGANRQSNCSSWGRNGLLTFSASRFVGIYDPISQQLLGTLPGHTAKVTSAQWIPNVDIEYENQWKTPEYELVSASVDKTIICWRGSPETLSTRPLRMAQTAVLKGHESGISCLAVHVSPKDGSIILASSATDGTVLIWRRAKETASTWTVLQVLKFGSKLIESLAFGLVPGTHIPLLACGGVDNMVHLFGGDVGTFKFTKLTSLGGHESWVRSLAFAECYNEKEGYYLLLASASQDRRVRLWKFEKTAISAQISSLKKLDPAALLAQLEANEEGQLEIEQHSVVITVAPANQWSIKLESVILGHDEWVLSVNWMPPVEGPKGNKYQPLRLLTSSMDKTMVVWTPDEATGLWIEVTRVGEVGGNQLGFFGAAYSSYPRESILALGYNGAFHLWRRLPKVVGRNTQINEQNTDDVQTDDSNTQTNDLNHQDYQFEDWKPEVSISGHFADVKDVCWDPSGNYFVSASKDQTARFWARWQGKPQYIQSILPESPKIPLNNDLKVFNWHEIGRPQVHGHDLSNLVFQNGVSHRFISCAEEKVLRVFDGSLSFIKSLANLAGTQQPTEEDMKERAATANVPALGLSNKPVFERSTDQKNAAEQLYVDIHPNGGYGDFDMDTNREGHIPLILSETPPFEEQLLQRTLWPEIAKLYGHGNELITVSSSRSGDIIASACSCKVQTQEQAGIRLWDSKQWKEIGELSGPTLTVTQMQFSNCDQYLLAVSRDRGVYLFKRTNENGKQFQKVFESPKAHLRVVWTCSWSWDDKFVATASRDKVVKLWKVNKSSSGPILEEVSSTKFKQAVTAVAFVPAKSRSDYILAVALENGEIGLWATPTVEHSKPTGNDSSVIIEKDSSVLANESTMTTKESTVTTKGSTVTTKESPVGKEVPSHALQLILPFNTQDVHADSVKKISWFERSPNHFDLISGSSDHSIRVFSVFIPSSTAPSSRRS